MVQMMRSRSRRPEQEPSSSSPMSKVKVEVLDGPFDETGSPLSKRPKPLIKPIEERIDARDNAFASPPSNRYNPLDEPSPLGLRLRKSPSLLDLIQMRLSQSNTLPSGHLGGDNIRCSSPKKEGKISSGSGIVDKLKASNFPGTMLRIGCWEYKSRYEGDLVGKCYFAKHKLVWEILEGGLKSKIEIQWSDIMAMKANCPDNEPGTLNVVLARQPLFFRETTPQPRKHTLWQATADFTNGQASLHRQHFLQCPAGLLTKHFEKLVQCDMRLNFLSRQPEIILDTPYFEQRGAVDRKSQDEDGYAEGSAMPLFKLEKEEVGKPLPGRTSMESLHLSLLPPSDQKPAANGSRMNKQMAYDPEGQEILEDVAQHILTDAHLESSSHDKRLAARVNSLCGLFQKGHSEGGGEGGGHNSRGESNFDDEFKEKAMSRKDSFGDLLLQLPRITSLPKFFFNISDDGGRQAR